MTLNEQQTIAANTLNGPILVAAAAGTGKTRVLIDRVNNLINSGINPNRILCFTFSNQAANEIINRCQQQIWIGTFHKICFRILQQQQVISTDITIIDEYDQRKIWDTLEVTHDMNKIKLHLDMGEKIPDKLNTSLEKYLTFMRDNNLIDFYHIIQYTIDYLKPRDCALFAHVMVDEYQDTNKQQEELIQLLLKHQENPNLFCVGDDDQCIYSWRGACINNFIQFQSRYHGAKLFKLEYNYRSTDHIVNSAFNIVKNNFDRMEKRGWTTRNGDPVNLIFTKNEQDQIVDIIKNNSGSCGILVRTIRQIEPIEKALVRNGIQYKVLGRKFTNKIEIKTILYYLKTILQKDKFSLMNIINYPRRGIGPAKISKLEELLPHMEFFDAITTISPELDWLRSITLETPGIISIILHKSGLDQVFTDEQKANITTFMDNTTIQKCLDAFGDTDDNVEGVSILTIHSSKGLEFDNVIIPGMCEGTFPVSMAIEEGLLNEERRICYVAFTRAKNKLFLLYQTSQGYHYKFHGPSRFLKDLKPEDILFTNKN